MLKIPKKDIRKWLKWGKEKNIKIKQEWKRKIKK